MSAAWRPYPLGEGTTPAGFMSSDRRVEWIPEVPGWPGKGLRVRVA